MRKGGRGHTTTAGRIGITVHIWDALARSLILLLEKLKIFSSQTGGDSAKAVFC